jgi:hypothetical protein
MDYYFGNYGDLKACPGQSVFCPVACPGHGLNDSPVA